MILAYYKNQIINWEQLPIGIFKRAIFYGESLFTSFRTHHQKLLFMKDHLDRLINDSSILYQINNEELIGDLKSFFIKGLSDLHQQEKLTVDRYIRLMVLSENQQEKDNSFSIIPLILLDELPQEQEDENRNLWCKSLPKKCLLKYSFKGPSADFLTEFKRGNYALPFYELRNISDNFHNEVIYLTPNNKLLSSTTGNVFIIKNGVILTPKLNSAILDGIIRRNIMSYFKKSNYQLKVKDRLFIKKNSFLTDEIIENFNHYCQNCLVNIKDLSSY